MIYNLALLVLEPSPEDGGCVNSIKTLTVLLFCTFSTHFLVKVIDVMLTTICHAKEIIQMLFII